MEVNYNLKKWPIFESPLLCLGNNQTKNDLVFSCDLSSGVLDEQRETT